MDVAGRVGAVAVAARVVGNGGAMPAAGALGEMTFWGAIQKKLY